MPHIYCDNKGIHIISHEEHRIMTKQERLQSIEREAKRLREEIDREEKERQLTYKDLDPGDEFRWDNKIFNGYDRDRRVKINDALYIRITGHGSIVKDNSTTDPDAQYCRVDDKVHRVK